MSYKSTKIFLTLAFLLVSVCLQAQQMSEEAQIKKIDDAIDTQVENYEKSLSLEDWQVFYIDSTLRHDFHALREEVKKLSTAKVSNSDLYMQVQDKWSEQMYNSIRRFLNEEQWAKYLKMGAEKEKKARDKRAAKYAGQNK